MTDEASDLEDAKRGAPPLPSSTTSPLPCEISLSGRAAMLRPQVRPTPARPMLPTGSISPDGAGARGWTR